MNRISNVGKKIDYLAGSIFGDEGGDEPAEEDFAAGDAPQESNFPRGHGFELSFMHYRDPELHAKPFFFTTQLGAAFPSYHMNPQPKFPARWPMIPGVKAPVESILAPRIRLAPKELDEAKLSLLTRMARFASRESTQPQPFSLNLASQALGDPYQYPALRAFLALNHEVRILNLNDNELEDITDIQLPEVVKLHASQNNFVSFLSLPTLPCCEELHLSGNFISSLEGLSKARFPRLRILSLTQNPVQHLDDLHRRLKSAISTLEVADGKLIR